MNKSDILVSVVIALLLAFYFKNMIDIKPSHLGFVIILLLIVHYAHTKEQMENFDGKLSNESLQTIASVYNDDKAVFKDVEITGNLKIGNRIEMSGDTNKDHLRIYANSDKKHPYLFSNKNRSIGISNGTENAITITKDGKQLFLGKAGMFDADPNRDTMQIYINKNRQKPYLFSNKNQPFAYVNTKEMLFNITKDGAHRSAQFCGFLHDFGGNIIPLSVGEFKLKDINFDHNKEDSIILAPGFGVKLWDISDKPNFSKGWNEKHENKSKKWNYFRVNKQNKHDFIKVYQI